MEVVVAAAISLDGYISTLDGDTDWVQDWELFESTCRDFGGSLMGRSTFDEGGSTFDGLQHIVLSSEPKESPQENVHFVSSVEDAVKKAQELGFSKLLVIGGAKTNESFMQAGVVTKLFIDLHELTLGSGKKLLGDFNDPINLKLISSQAYNCFVHLEYEVQK